MNVNSLDGDFIKFSMQRMKLWNKQLEIKITYETYETMQLMQLYETMQLMQQDFDEILTLY